MTRSVSRTAIRALGFLLVVAATGSMATACSSDKPQTQSQAASATTNADAATVTLIDAGAQPQSVVSYSISPDTTQAGTIIVSQGWGQASGAPGVTPKPQTTSLTLPYTSTGLTMTYGRPTGTNTDLNEDIATAEGFAWSTNADATGQRTQATLSAPEGATDSARASMEAAITEQIDTPVIFPAEPVGVGARWTVTVAMASQGTRIITYTLKSKEGNRVVLDATVDQKPAVTSLSLSDLDSALSEAGITTSTPSTDPSQAPETLDVANVTSATDAGTLTVDLTLPFPVEGSIDHSTTVTYAAGDTVVVQQNRHAIQWRAAR